MTTLWSYDFEAGVASGTVMTTANSNFKNAVASGWTFSNAHLLSQGGGALAGRCAPSGAPCAANDSGRPWAATNLLFYRFYVYVEKVPTSSVTCLAPWAGANNAVAEFRITSTGQVQIRNNSSSQVAVSSANLLTAGTYARVEGKIDITNGQQQVKVFINANVNASTPDYDSGLVTSAGGAAGITTFAFGATTATTATLHYDNLAFSNSDWLGSVVVVNQPPTCNAGINQSNIEPWSTVTLTATDADPDGTVVSRAWTQISGTPVVYTGAATNTVTFAAPATVTGDTGTHQYTVTDNLGATATSTVQVATKAASLRAVINGAEVPMRLFDVHSATAQNVPGAPLNVVATLTGSTSPYSVTVTWDAPASDGGSPITAYRVTREGNGTHNLAATARSDTFTAITTASPPFTIDVVAVNAVGDGPIAKGTTSAASTQYRFPGDTLPRVTGKILLGCTEADNDGTVVKTNWEWNAPEADTGKKYSITKIFYSGGSVENCFVPSTGGIASDMKAERLKGHIVMANIAIQQSSSSHFSTWRKAGDLTDTVVYNTYYNFIQWCEEGSDVPNVPIWVCMPHEAQQGPNKGKVDLTVANGMMPGDYADMQMAFRTCMNDYALSKVGGTDPKAYKWKHLSFGGIHTGEAFSIGQGSPDYDLKGVDNYYISRKTGLVVAPHDWVGADPYQQPISGATTIGRTGVSMWNAASKGMMDWCDSRGVPCVWGEFGIHNTDADAGQQLQAFWDEVTNGTHDIPAIVYFNSAPDIKNGAVLGDSNGTGRFILVNYPYNDSSKGTNGNLYNVWKNLMKDPKVANYWDIGYPKAPGL